MMIQSHPLKNLPSSWQALFRPMLLISIAIHGLLLLVPMPSKPKETPPKQEEKIKITQLPDTAPSPAAPISSKPQASITPRVVPPVRRQEAPIQQLAPRPKPLATPTNQESPKPQQTKPSAPPSTKQSSSSNFPPYPGSEKGSLGLLAAAQDKLALHTADGIDLVDSFFQKQLPDKGFNLTPVTQATQSGSKIYQISQSSGSSKYLYLLPKGTSTVILVVSQLVDLKDLVNAEASKPDEEAFNSVWDQLSAENSPIGNTATPDIKDLPQAVAATFADSSDPTIFSTQYSPRFETADFSKVHTTEEVTNLLRTTFIAQKFDFSEQPKVGDISIYKVTRGSFTNYISILPTKNGAGVITSQNPPGQ